MSYFRLLLKPPFLYHNPYPITCRLKSDSENRIVAKKLRFAAILSIVVPLFTKFQFRAKTGTIKAKKGRDYRTQKTGIITKMHPCDSAMSVQRRAAPGPACRLPPLPGRAGPSMTQHNTLRGRNRPAGTHCGTQPSRSHWHQYSTVTRPPG